MFPASWARRARSPAGELFMRIVWWGGGGRQAFDEEPRLRAREFVMNDVRKRVDYTRVCVLRDDTRGQRLHAQFAYIARRCVHLPSTRKCAHPRAAPSTTWRLGGADRRLCAPEAHTGIHPNI